MVRLKVFKIEWYIRKIDCFNSTMVRLKEWARQSQQVRAMFQFHYGTIKSPTATFMEMYQLRFNSTMVRLKDCVNV